MLHRPWISPNRDVSHPVLCRKFANIDSPNLTAAYKYGFSVLPQAIKQYIHKVCSQPSELFIQNKRVSFQDRLFRLMSNTEIGFPRSIILMDEDLYCMEILDEVCSRLGLASSMSVASRVDADLRKATYEEAVFGIPSTDFSIIKTIIVWLSRIRDRLARQSSGGSWYSRMMISRVSVAQLI
jgi:hypothetical protein